MSAEDIEGIITSDLVTEHEERFVLRELLKCDYFRRLREGYYAAQAAGVLNHYRNYVTLLECISDIHCYDKQHAISYGKRLREASTDWRNCEAIFSEVIVYRSYVRAVYEGLIRSIRLEEAEADVILERLDGSKMFMEVLCVMPDLPRSQSGEFKMYSIKTHTQDQKSSIRQKLLQKISKQNQFKKPRENLQ